MNETHEDQITRRELFPKFQPEEISAENREAIEVNRQVYASLHQILPESIHDIEGFVIRNLPDPEIHIIQEGVEITFADLSQDVQNQMKAKKIEKVRTIANKTIGEVSQMILNEENAFQQTIVETEQAYRKSLAYLNDPLTSTLRSPLQRITGRTAEQFLDQAQTLGSMFNETISKYTEGFDYRTHNLVREASKAIAQSFFGTTLNTPTEVDIFDSIVEKLEKKMEQYTQNKEPYTDLTTEEVNNEPLSGQKDAPENSAPPAAPLEESSTHEAAQPDTDRSHEEAIKSYWQRFSEIQSQEYYHGYGENNGPWEIGNWVAFAVRRDGDTTNTPALVVFPKNPTDSLRIGNPNDEIKISARLFEFLQTNGFNTDEYNITILEKYNHVLVVATQKNTNPHVRTRHKPNLEAQPPELNPNPNIENEPQTSPYVIQLLREKPKAMLAYACQIGSDALFLENADHSLKVIFRLPQQAGDERAIASQIISNDQLRAIYNQIYQSEVPTSSAAEYHYGTPRNTMENTANVITKADAYKELSKIEKEELKQKCMQGYEAIIHFAAPHSNITDADERERIRKTLQITFLLPGSISYRSIYRDTGVRVVTNDELRDFYLKKYNEKLQVTFFDVARKIKYSVNKQRNNWKNHLRFNSESIVEKIKNRIAPTQNRSTDGEDELQQRQDVLSRLKISEKLEKLKQMLRRKQKERKTEKILDRLQTQMESYIKEQLLQNVENEGRDLLQRMEADKALYAVFTIKESGEIIVQLTNDNNALSEDGAFETEDGHYVWVETVLFDELKRALAKLPSNP